MHTTIVFLLRVARPGLVGFALCVLLSSAVFAQPVTKTDPTVSTTTFPANQPPGDLEPGEAADASLEVVTEGGALTSGWNSATSTLTVTAVGAVSVSGAIPIRLPDNATQALKDHENGHRDLLMEEYNRVAVSITSVAFHGLTGSTYVGTGATEADRQANALAQAQAARDARLDRASAGILSRANELNAKYDTLTAHGSSATVDTQAGMTAARQERNRAVQAGTSPRRPAAQGPKAGAGNPPSVTYDPLADSLIFTAGASARSPSRA